MKLANVKKRPPVAKTVLGIDGSTQTIAFTIYNNRRPKKWGEMQLVGKDIFERAGDAEAKMEALLKLFDVDFMAIEKAIYVNNRETVIKLSYIFGAIIAAAAKKGIPVDEVPPLTWMAHIGNASLTKQQRAKFNRQYRTKSKSWRSNELRKRRKQYTMDHFNKRFKINLESDNVADSMGVALYAYEVLTRRR